ncbi:ankyrin repeat domain-containing protein, partial [Burkholderia cenocepacia]|uniref:ankyrin repeat domain-containing protein n=1 Tax=Burkholderia cenocepacia TaxID=95486 RepID=UPI00155971D3
IKQDAFAFSVAAYLGHMELLEKYLDLGADINGTEKNNALEKATDNNKLEAVKFLIEHGADVNMPLMDYDNKVRTNKPLENATSNHNLE